MNNNKEKIYALPIYFTCFIPLIVLGMLYDTGYGAVRWFPQGTYMVDVFCYGKMIAVIFTGICMLFLLTIYNIGKQIGLRETYNNGKMFIPLLIYLFFSIISTCFSKYRLLGFRGNMESFESVLVISGYVLIAVYSYMMVSVYGIVKRENVMLILAIMIVVIGIVGMLQRMGIDIYKWKFLQNLFMWGEARGIELDFTMGETRTYTSLSNPNYVGVMGALIIPVFVGEAIVQKHIRLKTLYIFAAFLMGCCVIGARAKTGIVIVTLSIVILLIIYRQKISRKSILLILIAATAFILLIIFDSDRYLNSLNKIFNGQKEPKTKITEIVTQDTDVRLVYKDKTIRVSLNEDGSNINIRDEKNQAYEVVTDESGRLIINSEGFVGIDFCVANFVGYNAFEVSAQDFRLYFTNQTDDGSYAYINSCMMTDRLDSTAIEVSDILKGHEMAITGRGFIWSRTLPLLRKYILIGSGADSFVMVYPNNDYLGKINWGYDNVLIDKPHNMYMQIAIQSGLIALVAFLCFFVIFIIKNIHKKSPNAKSIGLLIGIVAYLVMGMDNDSSITVAPIFWLLVGLNFEFGDGSLTSLPLCIKIKRKINYE